MATYNSKPSYLRASDNPDDFDPFNISHYDIKQENWRDFDRLSIGHGDGSHVLSASGYANASVDIGLQAAAPQDYASIRISLGNVVNLDAWANAGAAGTVVSSASSQGLLTLTDGKLSGTYTASLSIDVTATVAADHATIHMRITDSFELSLSGTGYVGASLLQTTVAGGTVVAMTPIAGVGGSPAANHGEQFDLARFAASVLNTGQWNIAFVASAAGESLHGVGTSVLTIAATADLEGGPKPERLNFYDTERSSMAFNDTSTPGMGAAYGMQISRPESISLFHDA